MKFYKKFIVRINCKNLLFNMYSVYVPLFSFFSWQSIAYFYKLLKTLFCSFDKIEKYEEKAIFFLPQIVYNHKNVKHTITKNN